MMTPTHTPRKRKRTISDSSVASLLNAMKRRAKGRKRTIRYKKRPKLGRKNKGRSLSGSKLKKVKIDSFERYGIKSRYEYVGQVATEETPYAAGPPIVDATYHGTQFAIVGHASSVPNLVLYNLAAAIIKRVSVILDQPPTAFTELMRWTAAGDKMYLLWQSSQSATPTSTDIGFASGQSWNTIANLLYGVLSATLSHTAEVMELRYEPVSASGIKFFKIDLLGSKIHMKINSTLKLQNVSLPQDAGDDTADEVTAIALQGTTFVGRGTGTALVRPRSGILTDAGLFSNNVGFITRRYAEDTQVIREIPRAEELYNVKKSGKLVMGPGQILSSYLKDFHSTSVNNLFRKAKIAMSDAVTTYLKQGPDLGNYSLHCLQKMVETTTVTPIAINYQMDHNYESYITTTSYLPTTQQVLYNNTVYQ